MQMPLPPCRSGRRVKINKTGKSGKEKKRKTKQKRHFAQLDFCDSQLVFKCCLIHMQWDEIFARIGKSLDKGGKMKTRLLFLQWCREFATMTSAYFKQDEC